MQKTLYDLSKESPQKLELRESYKNFKQLPFKKHSPLVALVSKYTIDIFNNKNNDEAIKYEIDCLDQVSLSNLGNCSSWPKHHSAQVAPSTVTPGIHSMLPSINKEVASVEAQYHCMSTTHKTIKFLNKKQIPINASDQLAVHIQKKCNGVTPQLLALPHHFWPWKIFLFTQRSSYWAV